MAAGVSTEWDDIQRRLGNLPAKPVEPTADEIFNQVVDEAEQYDFLANKGLEELNEMEDDLEEDVLEQYRRKRLQELQQAAMRPKFGDVIEISKQDFIQEVNQAPKDVFVIINLYQSYLQTCQVLTESLRILSKKFIHHKFVSIVATRCIENFRDSDCPALLIYQNGEMKFQFLAAYRLFGDRIIPEIVEWALAQVGIWETDLEEKPEPRFMQLKVRKGRGSSDESDDSDDRGYSSNHMPRFRQF